jgi:Flp pilus assembly protein TadD
MAEVPLDQAISLATKLQAEGKLAEAERIWRKIAEVMPGSVLSLNRLGIVLGMQGQNAEARTVFQRAIKIDPAFADAWANLALACENLKDLPAAISAGRELLARKPDAAEGWHRLGTCLGKSGDLVGAIAALRKSIDLNPDSAGTLNDLVLALTKNRDLGAAHEVALRGIAGAADGTGPIKTVADELKKAGKFGESTAIWREIVKTQPDNAELHGQLAMNLLAEGNFEEGWNEYEWRWQCKSFSHNVRKPIAREWGSALGAGFPDVAGRTILLYGEQGIGDTLQFIRYAAVFAERGARVIVEGPWPLKQLLTRCDGVRLCYGKMEQLPAYDWHVPLLNLPRALGTRIETIPAKVPYIHADASRVKAWKVRVDEASKGAKLKVGLAWAGNPEHKNDAHRSIDPALLLPLAKVEGVCFFSLQKAGDNKKCLPPPRQMRVVDLTSKLYDFAETAALMEQLDVVICVDTAVAHLAGAMGKRAWQMLSYISDFRWLMDREDSPWYPTMRLFRQRVFDEWEEVVERITVALRELVR